MNKLGEELKGKRHDGQSSRYRFIYTIGHNCKLAEFMLGAFIVSHVCSMQLHILKDILVLLFLLLNVHRRVEKVVKNSVIVKNE